MKIITRKVFSLCEDFNPDKGFQDMYDSLSEEVSSDVYIDCTAMTKETEVKGGYENDPVCNRLIELGAEDEEEVLIHIDY
tara:strand:+ start:3023 stop:3262 length:240 start_codon:yes stop_codon:yes gene_type:complete